MERIRLGRTGLTVNRTAFGVLPLQRTETKLAVDILRQAYEGGIDFYDTARGYSDSEEKIGLALSHVRGDIVIATKSGAADRAGLFAHCETSLRMLRTDYIDIYQLHNPSFVPVPGGADGLYDGMLELKRQGKIRHIGITCHRLANAVEAANSGLYETVQFPLSYLSAQEDLDLCALCARLDVGVIAMKALCGGLITNAAAAFAFLRQYDNVAPIWGIQHAHELEEFLRLSAQPPVLDETLAAVIEADRRDLSGSFCRGCGYCQPCPAGIPIQMAARMSLLLRRAPWQQFVTQEWQAQMGRIRDCQDCGHCAAHCPYGLDTPALLRAMLADYEQFVAEHA